MKIYVSNRETGTFIEEVATIEAGKNLIKEYEADDKKNGIYEPDFYDIVDDEHISLSK